MKKINFNLLCEFPYVSIGNNTFDLELERFIKTKDKVGCVNFIRNILDGKSYTDKYGDVIQLQSPAEKEEFKQMLINDYQFNKVCQHLGISAHKLFLIPKGSFKTFHETVSGKIVGPALINKKGEIIARGIIGQSHARIAETAWENAKEANDWDRAGEVIDANNNDNQHVFIDEGGNILNRKKAALVAARFGQLSSKYPDVTYLQSYHLHEDAMIAGSGGPFGTYSGNYASGDARVPSILGPLQRRFKVRKKRKKKNRK